MSHMYSFTTEDIWLLMSDGVRLSATLTIPSSKRTDEKFPVLLEYKPYRKDDGFYNFNQPNNYYLVRRGFIVAKVDIRGTGSSEGILIEREYTSQELDDCEQVIQQLADHPHSNGRVGMYGLSWSAFNSLMMATLRQPPALQAIFAAHGSEDLYKNDIHYADGILHLDEYILSVDHENALPATPDYKMDEQWIKERFTIRPWLDVYLEHQVDGPFWREHSIKYAYENLTVPTYLLAGLYDGYKDFAINIYENSRSVSSKIKVVVGPFVHSMPEYSNRNPGPGYDGKAEMVRWFNYWLKDESQHNDILDEPDITLFIRTSLTTGTYRYEPQWPIVRQQIRRMFMSKGQKLVQQAHVFSSTTTTTTDEENGNKVDIDTLEYRPWIGFEAGVWWDSLTSDQQTFDDYCLIYDSDPVNETIEIVGFVKVSLLVSATAPLAHWVVRLEDVDIDGQVWLVTGTGFNGAQRQWPPAYLEPNRMYTITFQLHFTTWTFLSGHRIRIAISNAMLPAFWPSPHSMNTSLYLDPSTTFIELPVIPSLSSISQPPPPEFTQLQMPLSDIFPQTFSDGKPTVFHKYDTGTATVITFKQISYELLPNGCFMSALLAFNFTCSHLNPADVRWMAYARQIYVFDMYNYSSIDDILMKNDDGDDESVYPDVDLLTRRHFELETNLILYSDLEYFYVDLTRHMFTAHGTTNKTPVTFVFNGKHKRQFQ